VKTGKDKYERGGKKQAREQQQKIHQFFHARLAHRRRGKKAQCGDVHALYDPAPEKVQEEDYRQKT
jgi:hypothetical protein